ncbi:restriction endonuclease subunit S [Campylobacter coli]|nr:restriction endonuclease subunit S [Campylobacter coli]
MRAYKDSGIKWLGEIPEHWEVVKIKHIAEIVTGKTPTLDSEWGDNMFFITPTDCDLDKKYVSSSLRKLSQNGIKNFDSLVIPKNSILVTCIASIGKVAINLEEVITNQQINSVIPNADLVLPDFIFYQLLATMPFAERYFCGYSILPILNKSEFSNIKIPLPPIEEQKAIAEFLDSKCKQIESFVDKKQKLITLLNEKKQALINECVTKGLSALCHCKALTRHSKDSPSCHSEALAEESTLLCHSERSEESKNIESQDTESRCFAIAQHDRTEYKDSGVEHLGAIPTHWEIKRLKYIVSLQNQKSGNIDSLVASLPQNDEYLCHSNDSASSRHSDLERSEREESHKNNNTNFRIGLENIESKTGKYIPTSEIVFEEDGIKFENGDILFGKLRPYLAKVFLADRGGICVSEFLVLRTKGANNHFLKFLMLSPLFIDIVDSSTYGTKMPRANWEFIGNLKIPLPPIEEQKQIAEFLDSEISKIDSIIEKIKKQIELIKEYKSTLINQAVCGRIGVQ